MSEYKLKIGIDLDNTITASHISMVFFAFLTNFLKEEAEIFIMTNRETDEDSRKEIEQELFQMNIRYDRLVITGQKAEFILSEGIHILFEDTDEYYIELPSSVLVFKIREPGNFDFDQHKWIYGDKTGRKI